MKQKQKANLMLIAVGKAFAESQGNAQRGIIAALQQAVTEKVHGEKIGKVAYNVLKDWADNVLTVAHLNNTTLRQYIETGAAIALKPEAVGVIKTGKGEKASTTEVTEKTAKNQAELKKVAEAARALLGIKKKPRVVAEKIDTDAVKLAAPIDAKTAEMAAKGYPMQIAELFKTAFDGKHGDMRETVIKCLAAQGFKLVPVEAKLAAVKPDAHDKAPVAAVVASKAKGKPAGMRVSR